MSDSFRFLIDLDQCLNLSFYDFFFYKLRNEEKLFCTSAELSRTGGESSLRQAAASIRLLLNSASFQAPEYQIIVTMRDAYPPREGDWEASLLCRMLRVHDALRRAGVQVSGPNSMDRAVNLFLLHNTVFDKFQRQALDPYLSSTRFSDDCALLFRQLGLSERSSRDEVQAAAERYAARDDRDESLLPLIAGFAAIRPAEPVKAPALAGPSEADLEAIFPSGVGEAPFLSFVTYVKTLLTNYQVFERLVNSGDPSDQVSAELQLVEYINLSTERKTVTDGPEDHRGLAERCRDNWQSIVADNTLTDRYAEMLRRYRDSLRAAESCLAQQGGAQGGRKEIPAMEIPGDRAIRTTGTIFSEGSSRELLPLEKTLLDYRKGGFRRGSAFKDTYETLKKHIENMEADLRAYAAALSDKYIAALEKRKQDTEDWNTANFALEDPAQTPDKALKKDPALEQQSRLAKLRGEQDSRPLSFQDELNMGSALEQRNANICFYQDCIRSFTLVNYLTLLLLVLVVFLAHYSLLQPYIFQTEGLLPQALLYLAAALLLLLLSWGAPRAHFRRKILHEMDELQNSMKEYISGYFDKADRFLEYINLLNQLDYLSRYSRMLERARQNAAARNAYVKWHAEQISAHLKRLDQDHFARLINLGGKSPSGASAVRTTIDPDLQTDVVDTPLYWPQA